MKCIRLTPLVSCQWWQRDSNTNSTNLKLALLFPWEIKIVTSSVNNNWKVWYIECTTVYNGQRVSLPAASFMYFAFWSCLPIYQESITLILLVSLAKVIHKWFVRLMCDMWISHTMEWVITTELKKLQSPILKFRGKVVVIQLMRL